jgi:dTDP-glucose pyrophosphorylase
MSSMKDIGDLMLGASASIFEAIKIIQGASAKIVLVTDVSGKLVGTVTDGDIRRGLLRGVELSAAVEKVMNAEPISVPEGESDAVALALMRQCCIHHMPIVDAAGRVVRIITDSEVWRPSREAATIVIMAGGLGSRLKPLTDTVPKPLLPIGGRPMLEIIIDNFLRQGFERIFLAVNYKAEMIQNHFGDGKRFGVSIEYLLETERLGTAGALRLLPKLSSVPVIVINGDILTTLDARMLLMFHREQRASATLCVCEHSWRVPYGVVVVSSQGRFEGIEEKPTRRELISAGINVLSPEAIALMPDNGPVDMPELMQMVSSKMAPPAIYPLREYWLDIGRLDDLQTAQHDIAGFFK